MCISIAYGKEKYHLTLLSRELNHHLRCKRISSNFIFPLFGAIHSDLEHHRTGVVRLAPGRRLLPGLSWASLLAGEPTRAARPATLASSNHPTIGVKFFGSNPKSKI